MRTWPQMLAVRALVPLVIALTGHGRQCLDMKAVALRAGVSQPRVEAAMSTDSW